MKWIVPVALVIAISGCEVTVPVSAPTIVAADFGTQSKTAGNYAVMIRTGKWNTSVGSKGNCFAWSFPVQLDEIYSNSARAGFIESFKNVSFVTEVSLTALPSDLNFDALIVVEQDGIEASFASMPGFLMDSTMTSSVQLSGHATITTRDGAKRQFSVSGQGAGNSSGFHACSDADAAVAAAASAGVKAFILDLIMRAKLAALELGAAR